MRINLTQRKGALLTRAAAAEELAYWIAALPQQPSGLFIIDFGDELATASWIDGFVIAFLRHMESHSTDARVLLVSSCDETRDHLSLVLEKRTMAAFAVRDLDDVPEGDVQVFGHVASAGREVLAAIQRFGEASVSDIATAVGATIEATQQRLTSLMEQRLIVRARIGRAYLYSFPVMQALELTAVAM